MPRSGRSPSPQSPRALHLEPLEDRLLLSALATTPSPPTAAAALYQSTNTPAPAPAAADPTPGDDGESYGTPATPGPSGNQVQGPQPSTDGYRPPSNEKESYPQPVAAPVSNPGAFELPPRPTAQVRPAVVNDTMPPPAPQPSPNAPPPMPGNELPAGLARGAVPPPPPIAPTDTTADPDVENRPAVIPAQVEDSLRTEPFSPGIELSWVLPLPPLPVDLPPVDMHAWAGAVEQLFQLLDAQAAAPDESSVWAHLTPWCVALGTLSVSVEFARSWLDRRAEDLTEPRPRGLAWRWRRAAGPPPPGAS